MTIEKIKKKIFKMGRKIGLDDESKAYPIFSNTRDVFNEGTSIYIENSKYYYIIMERGNINKVYESYDLKEILYLVFETITFEMASNYELDHRVKNKDSRRMIWKKQLELLEKIDKTFKEKCQKEIRDILDIAPFND